MSSTHLSDDAVAASGVALRGASTPATLRLSRRAGFWAIGLATFFTAGYLGISVPVLGLRIMLQSLSPRVSLLIFGVAVGLGILAAARLLVRPAGTT